MDDKEIVSLFFARSEEAIAELSRKYGKLCHAIAYNILNDLQDAEECVNDAYLGAWNSIPPQKPDPLRAYICRIVHNTARKKHRANTALKRGSGFAMSLQELENCIPGNSLEEDISVNELTEQINAFLATLKRDDRVMFLKRYWFAEPLSEIAKAYDITEHNASVKLNRIRGKFRTFLQNERGSLS